jgi:phosphoserine phosphatase RsbX
MVLSMISCATLPKRGEAECGDRCGWWETPEKLILAVADGLGHGPDAAVAAEIALACIGSALEASPEQLILRCNARLQDTRGVALTVVVLQKHSGVTTIASVGNIRTVLMTAKKDCRFGAARGIVGGRYGRLKPECFRICPGDVLVLFSDGLDEFTDMRKAMLTGTESSDDCAASILKKLANGTDDASLLLYRH